MVDAFNPPDLWQPFGPFSQIAVQGDGRIVHLKGQVALDRDGRIVGTGDMRVQLHQVLENIRTALASVGGEMSDILIVDQLRGRHGCLPGSRRHPARILRGALSCDDDSRGRASL